MVYFNYKRRYYFFKLVNEINVNSNKKNWFEIESFFLKLNPILSNITILNDGLFYSFIFYVG